MEPMLDPQFEKLENELLRAGREVHMSPALRAKTLATLGVAAVGVTTTTSAQAGTLGWLTSKTGALVGATLVGGATVAGAAFVTAGWGEEPTRDPARVVAPVEPSPVVEDPISEDAPQEMPAVELGDLEPEETVVDAGKASRKPVPPPRRKVQAEPQSTGLGDELKHLAQVESALRSGNPSAALSHLSEYRSRFRHPKLGLEAEVLTIQALHESGSTAAAQDRAKNFLQNYPQSPLGVRAKQYLK